MSFGDCIPASCPRQPYKGSSEIVELLLKESNIDVNRASSLSNNRWTPLYAACHNGKTDVAKLLLRCPKTDISFKGGSGYQTVLEYAREKNRADIVTAIESRATLLNEGHTC